jgi:predicted aconitase with swiveling domain
VGVNAELNGEPLIAGSAEGIALVTDTPLSFWGGYDWRNGEIIDRRHPLSGQIAAGRVLCIPATRGSSTTTAVLIEAIRAGTAPVAIITTQRDFFFALASVVAEELYAAAPPVLCVSHADFAQLRSGMRLAISQQGSIRVT